MIKAKKVASKILKIKEVDKLDRVIEIAFIEGSLNLLMSVVDDTLSPPQDVYRALRGRLRVLTDL